MAENIEEKVTKIVAEQFEVPAEKVTLNSLFMDDLKADSLSVVELVLAIDTAVGDLTQELQRVPTPREIAHRVGVEAEMIGKGDFPAVVLFDRHRRLEPSGHRIRKEWHQRAGAGLHHHLRPLCRLEAHAIHRAGQNLIG